LTADYHFFDVPQPVSPFENQVLQQLLALFAGNVDLREKLGGGGYAGKVCNDVVNGVELSGSTDKFGAVLYSGYCLKRASINN